MKTKILTIAAIFVLLSGYQNVYSDNNRIKINPAGSNVVGSDLFLNSGGSNNAIEVYKINKENSLSGKNYFGGAGSVESYSGNAGNFSNRMDQSSATSGALLNNANELLKKQDANTDSQSDNSTYQLNDASIETPKTQLDEKTGVTVSKVPAPAGTKCPNCRSLLEPDGTCPNCDYEYDGNTGTGTTNDDPITDNVSIFLVASALYLGILLFRLPRKRKTVE